MELDVCRITVNEALRGLEKGHFTSEELVQAYLAQIARHNEKLRAVIETNPAVLIGAKERDRQRWEGRLLGPLHGLPILLKASIATAKDLNMDTTSGNFVLRGSRPRRNAEVTERLLDSGAIILGKASLSELSYWKIAQIPAGWSPIGGQGQNAYVAAGRLAGEPIFSFNGPGGSSSGPSIGVAAGFAAAAIGTETSGSLIFPSDRAALYTIKPTSGIVPQSGIVPVSLRFDTAGPMAKCSRDVALLLDILVDNTKTNVPPKGYCSITEGSTDWSDIRVGVLDPQSWLHGHTVVEYIGRSKEQIVQEILEAYKIMEQKAKVLRHVTIESYPDATSLQSGCGKLMGKLFEYDYKRDFEAYISTVDNCTIQSLQDVLTADDKYAVLATPEGQAGREILERAISCPMEAAEAQAIDEQMRRESRTNGIDRALRDNQVDILLGPGNGPLYALAAAAGYPIATLPLSYLECNGCPFGLVALASAHQEALLLSVQSAWEKTFPPRKVPVGF